MIYIPKRELIIPIRAPGPTYRGRFKIEAVNVTDGRRRVLAEWFPNLITTNGANLLGSGNPLTTCAVGSGNAAPTLADTALQTLVASTNALGPAGSAQSAASTSPYFGNRTIQYNFAAGTATGNLSEVGVGVNATSLFSRALILDGGGSPTTITVLSTEALYVTYSLNQYAPTSDVTGTVTIGGVGYAYTLRAAATTSAAEWAYNNGDAGGITTGNGSISGGVSNGTISAVTGGITGTVLGPSGVTNPGYSAGSFTLAGTLTWGLTNGNAAGGVTAAQFGFGTATGQRGWFQIGFGTAIPKDGSHILTLSFSTTWAINTP